jgi:hypothetical protein
MTLREFMRAARHTSTTLSDLVSMSKALVKAQAGGVRRVQGHQVPRYFWASKGRLLPEDFGFDSASVWLPPLDKLPDPDDPGVSWDQHCAPLLSRLRAAQAVAKQGAENP